MDCPEAQEKLNSYLDGEISPEGVAAVQEHLRVCPRCAAELNELERLNQVLDVLQGIEVPKGFARRAIPAPTPVRARPLPVQVLGRVAAVLMAVAGLSFGAAMGGSVRDVGSQPSQALTEADDFDLQVFALSAEPADSVLAAVLGEAEEGETESE
ncbi:MAG: anti-sigma factor family protein [Planctomycetota bacterium]|jgi:anti-sigma factor RsiW